MGAVKGSNVALDFFHCVRHAFPFVAVNELNFQATLKLLSDGVVSALSLRTHVLQSSHAPPGRNDMRDWHIGCRDRSGEGVPHADSVSRSLAAVRAKPTVMLSALTTLHCVEKKVDDRGGTNKAIGCHNASDIGDPILIRRKC